MICMVLSRLIESMGHQACASHTLEEGLSRASSGRYDVILLDLEFPEGNGLQILPDLLKAPSLPEVIIITGTGDTRGAELAFKYGVWDFIQKPFTLEEASLPITRALQYRSEKGAAKHRCISGPCGHHRGFRCDAHLSGRNRQNLGYGLQRV